MLFVTNHHFLKGHIVWIWSQITGNFILTEVQINATLTSVVEFIMEIIMFMQTY